MYTLTVDNSSQLSLHMNSKTHVCKESEKLTAFRYKDTNKKDIEIITYFKVVNILDDAWISINDQHNSNKFSKQLRGVVKKFSALVY